MSFQEYLGNLRFEQAYRLVVQSSLHILDICMECGFSSSRYLNEMFVKRTGRKALDFRKRHVRMESGSMKLPIYDIQRRLTFDQAKKIIGK